MRIILALAVLAISQVTASAEEYPIKPEDRVIIEQAIRDSLKDPQSAIFGPMRAGVDGSANVHVCGLVNAKNSFGGYVGDQIFVGQYHAWSNKPSFYLHAISHDVRSVKSIRETCRDYGVF